jgi:hypothetical protein
MPIFKVFKDGSEEQIIQDSPQFSFDLNSGTKFSSVSRVIYYHKQHAKPTLIIENGSKFIMPGHTKVHPATTMQDIVHEDPALRKTKINSRTSKSSKNPNKKYKTSRFVLSTGKLDYTCNCPGTWMAKDGQCKHIKAIKLEFKD